MKSSVKQKDQNVKSNFKRNYRMLVAFMKWVEQLSAILNIAS